MCSCSDYNNNNNNSINNNNDQIVKNLFKSIVLHCAEGGSDLKKEGDRSPL